MILASLLVASLVFKGCDVVQFENVRSVKGGYTALGQTFAMRRVRFFDGDVAYVCGAYLYLGLGSPSRG